MQDLVENLYHYRCHLLRVVDGDTVDLDIDLGFHITMTRRVRLLGINAPETRGVTDRGPGLIAQMKLGELLRTPDSTLLIQTKLDRTDKYGRILGRIYVLGKDETVLDVNAELLRLGVVHEVVQ